MYESARDQPAGDQTEPDVLDHITVEYDGTKRACTMYPRDCPEGEITTTWITAEEGAYVDLETIR